MLYFSLLLLLLLLLEFNNLLEKDFLRFSYLSVGDGELGGESKEREGEWSGAGDL